MASLNTNIQLLLINCVIDDIGEIEGGFRYLSVRSAKGKCDGRRW
jgi:hypothetical protein